MTSPRHAPSRHPVPLGALWYGIFGAAAAWSVQALVSFAVISHSCYPSLQPRRVPAIAGTWTISLLVGLLMLLVAGGGAITAWAAWRRTEHPGPPGAGHHLEVGEGRARFMAASGLVVSGLILYTIVLNLIGLFIVAPCG